MQQPGAVAGPRRAQGNTGLGQVKIEIIHAHGQGSKAFSAKVGTGFAVRKCSPHIGRTHRFAIFAVYERLETAKRIFALRHTITAILATGLLCGLALLLMLAPLWRGFDALREIWPILLIIGGIAAGSILANRHRGARLLSLAAFAVILLPGIGETFDAWRSEPVAPSPGAYEISIGTHNLWGRNASPMQAATLLPPRAPDVLALQESFGRARETGEALVAQYAHNARCRSNRLLSNLPIVASGCVELPPAVLAAATIPCDWEMPPAVWARILLPDGSEAVFVSVHLTWPFPGRRTGWS